ncbi:SigE family RNA polymerase sigma factor [Kitasatospora aureofaciens]|uniref:SigE family RNA polymerase sigma factor n=1 Tax=Kitasatospora aureofaciens TaxID=1894 RepID=UPI000525CE4C|nr:SigE family RNA polymerase sigma factor [Kitasatospora aureofaciens]HJD84126.1 SigE family RNA polymerase sigma factor [Kitasatospora aureofaciens]
MTGIRLADEAFDDGFTQFVKEVRPRLRRNAFVLVGDWFEADDLVQRTLIAVYRRWDRLEQRDDLNAYTRTVMVRQFISERRGHRWSRELIQNPLPEPEPAPEDVACVGDRVLLLGALAELAPRQRSLVFLRYWEDLSIEETARTVGCSPATVRSSTSRTLRILRERLGALYSDDTA